MAVAKVEDVTLVGLIVLDATDVSTEGVGAVAAILETESKVKDPDNPPVL